MKIKEIIEKNNENIALLPDWVFKSELIAENEELYKKLENLKIKKVKRKKWKINFHFNFKKISDYTEKEKDYYTQLWVDMYKNNKF